MYGLSKSVCKKEKFVYFHIIRFNMFFKTLKFAVENYVHLSKREAYIT